MLIRSLTESEYTSQAEKFAASRYFQSLEAGTAVAPAYDDFIAQLCRTHLKSPQILAFLYAIAPPAVAEAIKHNMLEELGLDEEGVSHPQLLLQLARAAGFDEKGTRILESQAQEELRRMCTDPILFGTFKEFGLTVLLEVTCFEWMLSRLASRIARFLSQHRKLSDEDLKWFTHHAEVDLRHAEEGLDAVVKYARYYDFEIEDFRSILEITFRENVFIKRYFGEVIALTEEENEALLV